MSKTAKIIVYSSFIVIFGIFITLLTILFSFFTGPSYDFEMLLTAPGLYSTEWIFSLWMISVTAVLVALISEYLATYLYFKIYVRYISRKSKIGITQINEISPAKTWVKIFMRSLTFALFSMNISYMLASQSIVVDLIRTDLPLSSLILPDTLTMFGILYLVIIPCTFLLVPIWISNDIGLVSSKKIRNTEVYDSKLISSPIYKLVKGYVGIGFVFNLIILIIDIFLNTYSDLFSGTLLLLAPLIIVFFVTPMLVLMEIRQKAVKIRMLRFLEKMGLNQKIEVTMNIKPLDDTR